MQQPSSSWTNYIAGKLHATYCCVPSNEAKGTAPMSALRPAAGELQLRCSAGPGINRVARCSESFGAAAPLTRSCAKSDSNGQSCAGSRAEVQANSSEEK